MEYPAIFAIVAGFVATIIIGLLTRATWPSWAKVVMAGAVAVVLGLVELWIAGDTVWSWSNLWPIAAAVFVLAKAWFTLIAWKVPGLQDWWERHGLKPSTQDPTPTQ
jgi:hypothetical protein